MSSKSFKQKGSIKGLNTFVHEHGLKYIAIGDLIESRKKHDRFFE